MTKNEISVLLAVQDNLDLVIGTLKQNGVMFLITDKFDNTQSIFVKPKDDDGIYWHKIKDNGFCHYQGRLNINDLKEDKKHLESQMADLQEKALMMGILIEALENDQK